MNIWGGCLGNAGKQLCLIPDPGQVLERKRMKRTLKSIAAQLTEDEIQEIIKLKKMGDKKNAVLIRKRDKLAAQLADVEAELAKRSGGKIAPAQPKRRGRKPASESSAPVRKTAGSKPAGRRRAAGSRRNNFSASVREVFAQAGTPLRARQVVEGLPGVGVKVKDESDMRKRVSVVLAQHKNHFEQVERGVYRLRDQ